MKEQEYLLRNITPETVTFVVEHALPQGWTVDSDPQPVKIVEGRTYLRVLAVPGQIVRLHVGERHAEPLLAQAKPKRRSSGQT